MTTQNIYSVSPRSTPFSITPGGLATFANTPNATPPQAQHKAVSQITWTLRDRITDDVFVAYQDVSTDHAALYSAVVSEIPLHADHVYETISVSASGALTKKLKTPSSRSNTAQNRMGVARGTYIMTSRGEMPVERLTVGDRVITRDHGMQEIRWIGSEKKHVTAQNAPILFKKGAIKNNRDLIVSADHRVVFKGAEAMMLYGVKEVLIPARKMVNDETIIRATSGEVEFFQIVLDQHEVIYCEAAATESFMPDENGIAALSSDNQSDMLNALPVLKAASDSYGPTARGFVDAETC
ncbi:Hint domain-containing protein [Amylibacter sp. IMCC11727]|uniref:Hint domain-containing protein n=1 Tax=Amylibacter sp. IMCC11727 TaxID=3039851 RepID=UPI00244E5520|nr:Hint domain-containing protein [Amylibacter sp. IMCC11727]WGI20532.1 Hint domain-containing protein [Amylibacter sp. IMCC11727]